MYFISKNRDLMEPWLLGFTLLLLKLVESFEVRFIYISLLFLLLWGINNGKGGIKLINLQSLLFCLLIVGAVIGIFHWPIFYDYLKDLIYFLKPILLIFIGFFFARRIKNERVVLKTLILVGVIFSIYHIIHTLIYSGLSHLNISKIRAVNGLDNMLEIIAMVLIIISYKHPSINVIKHKSAKVFFLLLTFISFILYFSRSMLIGFFLITLGAMGYAKLNIKGIKYISLLVALITTFYIYLFSIDIPRDAQGFDNFLYKIKMAPAEIFIPKIDLNNHADLWDHWRAYEVSRALNDMSTKKVNYLFGKGFGSLVDLKTTVNLGGQDMRYIPILHNGYAFVFYKTGLLGLLVYFTFLFYLYSQTYIQTHTKGREIFNNFITGLALYYLFSSLIITGIYNLIETLPLILGIMIYLSKTSLIDNKTLEINKND